MLYARVPTVAATKQLRCLASFPPEINAAKAKLLGRFSAAHLLVFLFAMIQTRGGHGDAELIV